MGRSFKNNKGLSLIELIIVIAIMAVLVGIITPMFVKHIEKSKKAKDVWTADQIAKAVQVAFIENPEAEEAFESWTGSQYTVSATVHGVTSSYKVCLVASSGTQNTNKVSNCFNGGSKPFYVSKTDGSDGFYGCINEQLGLDTKKMNSAITPKYSKKKEGVTSIGGRAPGVLDRYRIVKRVDNGQMEIWAAQANPYGGFPVYRLWPVPDDIYFE